MSSEPRIVAEAHLPSTLLFTPGPDPELKMTLKLVGVERPVTISRDNNALFTLANAFQISKVPAGDSIYDFWIDRCRRLARAMPLDPDHADDFVTLQPGVPYLIYRLPFRPLGQERRSQATPEASTNSNADPRQKYRFIQLGMHLMEPGMEYFVRAREGIQIGKWRWGTKEELMPCDWLAIRSDGDEPIKVVSGEGVKVRVDAE